MPGENRLLVIAMDVVQGRLYQQLNNAKSDATRIANILQDKYGFILTQQLFDSEATKVGIEKALHRLSIESSPDDRIVIYYAGHGERHPTTKRGSWVPYDGADDYLMYINHSAILEKIREIDAKHILLISDSCYSGAFITQSRSLGIILTHQELDALKSRWVFASCGEEKVGDGPEGKGSPFSQSLSHLLETDARASISAGDIFNHVIREVEIRTKKRPGADSLTFDHDGGQMIFKLKAPVTVVAQEEITTNTPEFISVLPTSVGNYIPRTVTAFEHQRDELSFFFQPEKGISYLKDLINVQDRIVLLGTAGSGKSIELANLAKDLSEDSPSGFVPVYKKFNTYIEQAIETYLPSGWETIPAGSAVILLDGLDEVQSKYFNTAQRQIIAFSEKFKDLKIVISCRSNFYELPSKTFHGTLEGFAVQQLNDLSLLDVKNYLDRLKQDGDQFIKEAQENSFFDLIQKPYFLEILHNYYRINGSLDIGRLAIMNSALNNFYDVNRQHYNTTTQFPDKSQTFKMLEKIAFVLEVVGKNFLTDAELRAIFPDSIEFEFCRFLPGFKKYPERQLWAFEHNNLQEFLAARVLAGKSYEELIEIVTAKAGSVVRIRPNWVNTISFLISMDSGVSSNMLLDWIVEHDIEIIVRFDADRLNADRRTEIVKRVFNFYEDKNVWLASNKFQNEDLARFGQTPEVLDYLIEKLEGNSTSIISKLSAVQVVKYFEINYFPQTIARVQASLLGLLEIEQISFYGIQTVIGALAELGFTDKDTLDIIVGKYRNHLNQHIRAALYKILHNSEYLDDYLDIFLEGLDLKKLKNPVGERGSVTLLDENTHLKIGLEKIKKAPQLKVLLESIRVYNRHYLFLHEYKEMLKKILINCLNAFQVDQEIYVEVRLLFMKPNLYDHKFNAPLFLHFFEQTNTVWQTFEFIWRSEGLNEYSIVELTKILVNSRILDEFIKGYEGEEFETADIEKMHQIILWNPSDFTDQNVFLERIEQTASKKEGLRLERPPVIDWNRRNAERIQYSFNLVFDPPGLIRDLEQAFESFEKKELTRDDLSYFNLSVIGKKEIEFPTIVLDLMRQFSYHRVSVKLPDIRDWILTDRHFINFQIDEIYKYLNGSYGNAIQVDTDQQKFIQQWCEGRNNNLRVVWNFLERFQFQLSPEKILDLTMYYDANIDKKLEFPGTIDRLEQYLEKEHLKKRVTENLSKVIFNPLIWVSNAAYALRQNMKAEYPKIIQHLIASENYEYKFEEVLELWYKKTQYSAALIQVITEVKEDSLRWSAIHLLRKSGVQKEFLLEFLKKIMQDTVQAVETVFRAVGYLFLMDDVDAFYFTANYLLKKPDPFFNFYHWLQNMPTLTHLEIIPRLLQLLMLARTKEFQKNPFNDFESAIMNTIFNIGSRSVENFEEVKSMVDRFAKENLREEEWSNFLYFQLARMEEHLLSAKWKDYTVQDAMAEWV